MKKHILLLLSCFVLLGSIKAQAPNLFVDSKVTTNGSGIFTSPGTINGRPYWIGPTPNNSECIYWNQSSKWWLLVQWRGDTTKLFGTMSYLAKDVDIPVGVWNSFFTVDLIGPKLNYSLQTLIETSKNEGSFSDKIIISHNKYEGQLFGGNNGDDFIARGYAKVEGLPEGLQAVLIRLNDSTLELSLMNKAIVHDKDSSFTLVFNDGAYTNGGKADSTINNSQKINLDFIKIIAVAKNGGDFETIQTALDNAKNHDIIEVAEGVYTERINNYSLTNISIIGKGPDKTILQADTAPGIATDRVINSLNNSKLRIEGLTIRNGYSTNFGAGAGIRVNDLIMRNCRVVNNIAYSSGSNVAVGGGISGNNLYIYDSEISENSCSNVNKQGLIQGGGIYCEKLLYIENSTVSGNYCGMSGGGISIRNNGASNIIINTTVSNNTAEIEGGGIYTNDSISLINTIVWGNNGPAGDDIFQLNNNSKPIKLIHTFVEKVKGKIADTAYLIGASLSGNPLLDTLSFNCATTRTHALLAGSAAIDAGDSEASVPKIDQRGFSLQDNRDVGSHEFVGNFGFNIGRDSICIGSSETLELKSAHKNGIFTGEGVLGNIFSAEEIKSEGIVYISYTIDAIGCDQFQSTDSIYVYDCRINDIPRINSIALTLYPNPAFEMLWIKTDVTGSKDIQIAEISGKVVFKSTMENAEEAISLKDIPKGVYIVSTVANGIRMNQKFIKL
jgi:hypothetical protein